MSKRAKGSPYNRSVPLNADVVKLVETFTAFEEGALITHEQIESILEMSRKNGGRYRSVTNRWRKHVRSEKGIELLSVHDQGFLVPAPHELSKRGQQKVKIGTGYIMRGIDIVLLADPNRLEGDDLRTHQHYREISGRLLLAELMAPEV